MKIFVIIFSSGLIGQWRDDLEDALLSLQGWVPYLRRKVPGIVISPPPFLDTGKKS